MATYLLDILKGVLIGAANVVPGVSGGTMALLTGIFERLIRAVKAFDLEALKLAGHLRVKELADHLDLRFLSAVGAGMATGILVFARLLEYLFAHHALQVWAFFFGLILASVYFVGRRIGRLTGPVAALFLLGAAVAGGIGLLEPAAENGSFPYLLLCGAVAMCSMVLPGLSGSYVLLLMGNYQLVMIDAVSGFRLEILLPVGLGAAAGLAAFARLLAWVFSRYHDRAVALLTGFIFGSLGILWPWKSAITETFGDKAKVVGYDYALPAADAESAAAAAIMVAGIAAIVLVECAAARTKRG